MSTKNSVSITEYKKRLAQAIEKHNYNLQAPEVLQLSQQLDAQIVPTFKKQLDFQTYYLKTRKIY
ncbi:hypothetical protein AN639_03200 [Candidatus Epulonipiscium fishelsonii]|uniref:Uncharacterized protein n=1 Tax=Candidatus Epulonipiscium fishelsonii TaxID=77094 RepID=A0ACC8XGF8_9FIRM|nr:hypothetical protein AN639_03200 [Epulopiscium sp. SCG-B05WGA-EpuloA1]ONI42623.1 hypothetical protein AN396_13655 [Epulopiscium sp. SCG-B11WGA-EpuloA1]ONI47245.1 hypothetical protein AN644_01115 [Epulopiscium sp. SCG-C06WGA-EpuloA1]